MNQLLIAVKSCVRDRNMHALIRESWAQYLPDNISLRFFMGDGELLSPLKWDEIQLPGVPDDYKHLPEKVREICSWVDEQNFDYVMLIDNDTFIHPERLMALFRWLTVESVDYYGKFFWKSIFPWAMSGDYRFAFGGLGYFLSKKAAALIADAETLDDYRNEDEWVGRVMHEHAPLFRIEEANRHQFERYVSWHYPKFTYRDARYQSDSLWQRVMMYQHLGGAPGPNPNQEQLTLSIDDRKPFVDFEPGVNAAARIDFHWLHHDEAVYPNDIQRAISRLIVKSMDAPEDKLLEIQNRLVALSLVKEIESKPARNILRSEWEALATAYTDLGKFKLALACAKYAFQEDTPANKIKIARAYDAAGYYKQAHAILLSLYTTSQDYNLLPLLRAAAKRV